MGSRSRIRAAVRSIVCIVALLAATQARADRAAVHIYATHSPATVFIQSVGTMFNGTTETATGSGLLIGSRTVITNDHVVPDPNNYRTLEVTISLGAHPPIHLAAPATDIFRDQANDLAILRLPEGELTGPVDCPVPIMDKPDAVPIGTTIFALGYPVGQALSLTDGLISNKSGAKGRWQMNVLINPGSSGGPIFTDDGLLVGFAVAGIVKFNGIDVDGVNFLIPLPTLLKSDIFKQIEEDRQSTACWGAPVLVAGTTGPEESAAFNGDAAPNQPEVERLLRNFAVSETKDDHPVVLDSHSRNYEKTFQAEEGLIITKCSFTELSANHASDIICNILPGSHAAQLSFRLTSGPSIDRWRGWLAGTVVLTEEPAQ